MSDPERPQLQVIDEDFVEPTPEPEAKPAPPPTKSVSIGEQVESYADLIRDIRSRNKNVTEGGLIKIIEIVVNSHFTSLSLNQQLAQMRALSAPTEEPNGNDSEA